VNHYETLGVDKSATPEEIKAAYRKLASRHHPDREGGDTQKFQALQKAYDVLSDSEKRRNYDETGDGEMSQSMIIDSIINDVLMQIIESERVDPKHHDLANTLLVHFQRQQAHINNQIYHLRQMNKMYRQVFRRMKANNPIIHQSLRQRRLNNVFQIRNLKQQRKMGEQVIERVKEYQYDFERIPQAIVYNSSGWNTSSWPHVQI